MVNELAIGDLMFRQHLLAGGEQLSRKYDVTIACLSWEARSPHALTRLKNADAAVTLLKFKSRSDEVEAAKSARLKEFRDTLKNVIVKDLDAATEIDKNLQALKRWLQDLYNTRQKPISMLIDVTCIPKSYVLYLIGLGFSEELVSRMDCLYTPGRYDLVATTATPTQLSGPRSLLSEGEWHSRQVPYLEASDYIASEVDLFVTLGGELGLSLPFIERFEPRRLRLVFIEETSPSRGGPILPNERLAYEDLLREPNAEQIDIGLCDAIGVAQDAMSFIRSSNARGTTMMAIGSKPHAIGAALAALGNPRVEVVCRTPASYRVIDVPPSADPFLYEIEDRFDPLSFIS